MYGHGDMNEGEMLKGNEARRCRLPKGVFSRRGVCVVCF